MRLSISRVFRGTGGVLSGFKREIPLQEVLSYGLPYADSYDGFWKNPVSIQHPLAELEIVAWDSTLTLLISRMKPLSRYSGMRIRCVKLWNRIIWGNRNQRNGGRSGRKQNGITEMAEDRTACGSSLLRQDKYGFKQKYAGNLVRTGLPA